MISEWKNVVKHYADFYSKMVSLWVAGAGRRTNRPTTDASTWPWSTRHPSRYRSSASQFQEHHSEGSSGHIQAHRPSGPLAGLSRSSCADSCCCPTGPPVRRSGLWISGTHPDQQPPPLAGPEITSREILTRSTPAGCRQWSGCLHLFYRLMQRGVSLSRVRQASSDNVDYIPIPSLVHPCVNLVLPRARSSALRNVQVHSRPSRRPVPLAGPENPGVKFWMTRARASERARSIRSLPPRSADAILEALSR
jgi:hypothetical protein